MNKLLTIIILFLCMAIHANAQIAAKDSTRVSTEVVAQAQLKKLTRELDLTKAQQIEIFNLLSTTEKNELESAVAWDDLMKILTFQQKSMYLRLLELDKDSENNFRTSNNQKMTPLSGAQYALTLNTTDKIKDVRLVLNRHPDGAVSADRTYNTYSKVTAMAWTYKGQELFSRTIMKFILDEIPAGSQILIATLHFYSDPTVTSSSSSDGNSQLSGSNAFYLERIVEPWSDQTVTWNNQPATSTLNRLLIPASTSTTENISINLTDMVQAWVINPETNYGVKMFLQNEVKYRSRNYGSMDHTNTAIRPHLEVEYNEVAPSTIEYTYDASGHRTKRELVEIGLKSAQQLTDQDPVEDRWEDRNVIIFPNPTKGNLKIRIQGGDSDESLYYYSVFDTSGKMRSNGILDSLGEHPVSFENLPPGIYLLTLKHNEQQKTYKIIKE